MTAREIIIGLVMLIAGMIAGWQMHGVERANPDEDSGPGEKPE